MKYVVIFKDDSGRMHVKDAIFHGLMEAESYADTVDASWEPTILPYIPMYPKKNREFTPDGLDDMASMLSDIRMLFLFSSDMDSATQAAQHQYIMALSDMEKAVQQLRIAALTQAKAVGDRQRGRV